MSDGETRNTTNKLWDIAKSLCLAIATVVLSIKVLNSPFSIALDAATLISLLLALFAIWLSALFYFKATETSNAFYDNTYKFTRDVAQLLAKMESGFGERLKNLDEGYASMRGYFQSGQRADSKEKIEDAKQKLDEEKEELRKTVEARNKIVRDLIERSHLQAGEKEQVAEQLKEKEKELEVAQVEISKLNKRIFMDRVRSRNSSHDFEMPDNEGMNSFAVSQVVEKIGRDVVMNEPSRVLRKKFDELTSRLPDMFLSDLSELGLYNDTLTANGIAYLRALAKRSAA